jgi:CBS domain-containing protein
MATTISDLTRKKLITVEESASVQEAAKRMMDKNIKFVSCG